MRIILGHPLPLTRAHVYFRTVTMLDAIVVLNEKYRPGAPDSAPLVGASSFVSAVLKVFRDCSKLACIVYYRRDEGITKPRVRVTLIDACTTEVTISFNFNIAPRLIQATLRNVFTCNTKVLAGLPIIYYQTDTLVEYHPKGIPFCVTHHGPLVADFVRCFSQEAADEAFGNKEKANLLARQQQKGFERLARDQFGFAFAHSGLQQRLLGEWGLDSRKCLRITPPIHKAVAGGYSLPPHVDEFTRQTSLLLFTAVARLDIFKNVQLVVEAGLQLLDQRVPASVLVAGDPTEYDSRRNELRQLVPQELLERFMIIPKLTPNALFGLFAATQRNGIFICPSRYETLGITPLEAATSGTTTLIVDSENVEAASYFPSTYRFKSNPSAIAEACQSIKSEGVAYHGAIVQSYVSQRVDFGQFQRDLLNSWKQVSNYFLTANSASARRSPRRRKRSVASAELELLHRCSD